MSKFAKTKSVVGAAYLGLCLGIFFAASVLITGANAAPLAPETFTISQSAPGSGARMQRRYHVLLPPNLKRSERPPAVMVLHDAGDDALAAVYRHGWIATAIQARFAVIAPEAGLQHTERPAGGFFNARVWNAGVQAAAGWDDAAFLIAVAKDAAKRKSLDPARIFLVGFGEGGAMAQRMLSAGGKPFAGFASVAGPLYGAPESKPSAPLYLLFGGADPTNPTNGGAIFTPWAAATMAPTPTSAIQGWRQALGCAARPTSKSQTRGVYRNEWLNCRRNAALHVVWIEGLGRQWPGTGAGPLPTRVTGPANDAIFAPWDIWRFFEARRLAR